MVVRYSKYLTGIVFIADILLLNVALFYAHFFTHYNYLITNGFEQFFFLGNVVWLLTSAFTKSYKIGRALIVKNHVRRFFTALIYHVSAVLALIYFLRLYEISRLDLLFTYVLFTGFVLGLRFGLLYLLGNIRKKGYNHRQVVIIGDNGISSLLEKSFKNHPEYGYDILNKISDEQISTTLLKDLLDKIYYLAPHEIFVCYKNMDGELLKSLFTFADTYSLKIKLVTEYNISQEFPSVKNTVPYLELTGYKDIDKKIRVLKRCFDVSFSLAVMILGLPAFLLLYIITKTTSKGPAFYKQERIGKRERPFHIYKFRSMHVNSEKLGPQLSAGDYDPRITKWGRIMRKTRLDELPQFWNVLKGDMAIVGPRPERQYYIDKIVEKKPSYKRLLTVKPGITSMGQVRYGYAENVDQMCERLHYDLFYLNNINLNNDLGIILQTVKVMVQRKGK